MKERNIYPLTTLHPIVFVHMREAKKSGKTDSSKVYEIKLSCAGVNPRWPEKNNLLNMFDIFIQSKICMTSIVGCASENDQGKKVLNTIIVIIKTYITLFWRLYSLFYYYYYY